ncbi:Hsp70 family protein [Pseudochryseolinea flava]|uniref:Hsp70 family protein n=2 Tax=Pseudochryseolinea flava TaxID=2059302 RepID=A0A364Y2R1_9BACT|nr:Hsp70 family protein [Pseudochryseolinea flava]
MVTCGIDFGTSNSGVALATTDVKLLPVEGDHVTIPSAVFYPKREFVPVFGREAMRRFFDKQEGRLMRSLKRVLGTSLMKQGTMVNGKVIKFEKIIGSFLENIKQKTDHAAGIEVDHVVMGRPVHFIDNDPQGDEQAQHELAAIAKTIGFKFVEFQYEPIAAAFAHEVKIVGEKLAIVVDLGGGTSDFTIIKLSNNYIGKVNRASDILANTGVRIGGNDFDKKISLTTILPEIGYGSTYGDKKLEVPLKPYHDLSEWSRVNFIYNIKTLSQTRELLHQSHDKKRFGRLLRILESESGHTLLAAAEDTKVALTPHVEHRATFGFLDPHFFIDVTRDQFENAIQEDVQKIVDAANECLRSANIGASAINLVILTGGSTEVPLIQKVFKALFTHATISDENKLSSVALGLAYDSKRRFA